MKDNFAYICRYFLSRKPLYFFNVLLYRVSLNGIGVYNFKNRSVSGENHFINKYFTSESKGVVIDVGANIGEYSNYLFSASPLLTIYALEPHPDNYDKLNNNVQSPNISTFNIGAGVKNEDLLLYDVDEEGVSTHASVFQDVITSIHNKGCVQHKIKCVKLSSFMEEKNIHTAGLFKPVKKADSIYR